MREHATTLYIVTATPLFDGNLIEPKQSRKKRALIEHVVYKGCRQSLLSLSLSQVATLFVRVNKPKARDLCLGCIPRVVSTRAVAAF